MIIEVEALMQHWGEQCRRVGLAGGGVRCSLAALIDWQGAPPRGQGGAVVLHGGVGIGPVAQAVDAAVAALKRSGDRQDAELALAWREAGQAGRPPFCLHTQLVKLARVRYLSDPMPWVEQQMRRCKSGSARTYVRRVNELHEWVQAELARSAGRRCA